MLCLEWLYMDKRDLGTRLCRVVITNNWSVNVFWLFDYYFDHFWYKFHVVKGSDVCHNTYFRVEYNLSPVQASSRVIPYRTDREDMVMGSILKSWMLIHHSGNPFYKHWFKVLKWNSCCLYIVHPSQPVKLNLSPVSMLI